MLRSRTLSLPAGPARPIPLLVLAAFAVLGAACARPSRSPNRDWESIERDSWSRDGEAQEGIVSWYDESELTAMGTRYDPDRMAAAHKTLPFGTVVRVTRMDTRDSVVVEINDRGPWIEGRIIDLARRPAQEINLIQKGIAPCRVEVLHRPDF